MYSEIRAIVVAKFQGAGEDLDDLVQETALKIARMNGTPSAWNPALKTFAAYVVMVGGNKRGHMLGSAARRRHPQLATEGEALAVLAGGESSSEAAPVEATRGTIGAVVEQLGALARRAHAEALTRARVDVAGAARAAGLEDGLRAAAELLGTAFHEQAAAAPPLGDRVIGVLATVVRPMSAGQLSAALCVSVAEVERGLAALGGRVVRRGRGAYELAPFEDEDLDEQGATSPTEHETKVEVSDADEQRDDERGPVEQAGDPPERGRRDRDTAPEHPAPDPHAEVRRTLSASLARWQTSAAERAPRPLRSRRVTVFPRELHAAQNVQVHEHGAQRWSGGTFSITPCARPPPRAA